MAAYDARREQQTSFSLAKKGVAHVAIFGGTGWHLVI
jgi:hypothetical protein